MVRSYYYRILLFKDKSSKIDITSKISGDVTLTEDDEKIKSLNFVLDDASYWLDVISLGHEIEFIGGTLEKSKLLFLGSINLITPEFSDHGKVKLIINALSKEKVLSALQQRDLFYPSSNSPFSWARSPNISASEIIKNLALENGYKLGTFFTTFDVSYNFKSPKRQYKQTDWTFIQKLAEKIKVKVWISYSEGSFVLNCCDEAMLVNTISDVSFYYPLVNSSNEFELVRDNPKYIQLSNISIDFGSLNTNGLSVTTATDPETGETVEAFTKIEDGDLAVTYIFDSAALANESSEVKDALYNGLLSGVAWNWESVKKYFKKISIEESSSREPLSDKFVLAKSGEILQNNGVLTNDSELIEGQVVEEKFGYKFTENTKELSPERKTELISKFSTGQLTDEEIDLMFEKTSLNSESIMMEDDLIEKSTSEDGSEKSSSGSGFSISGVCWGDVDIVTKRSYPILGLAKYSRVYYLKQIIHTWGSSLYKMQLTFTK